MENKYLLIMHSNWGDLTKEIIELSEENSKDYKVLGKGYGINIDHCLQLANKYCEGFLNRVVGYRIINNDKRTKMFSTATKKECIAVEFYEKI